ncbi:hypothetical protein EFO33_12585 [Lactococcus cremoris]|nr:hypothetical protein [Lactococcus cremoris]
MKTEEGSSSLYVMKKKIGRELPSPVRSQRTPKWEEVLSSCWVLKYRVLGLSEWTWVLSLLFGLVHDVKSKEQVSFLVAFPIKSIRKAISALMTICLQKIS